MQAPVPVRPDTPGLNEMVKEAASASGGLILVIPALAGIQPRLAPQEQTSQERPRLGVRAFAGTAQLDGDQGIFVVYPISKMRN